MVDYVFACEFDIKFGTYLRSSYPKNFDHSCDSILVDYMMPDGTHRIDEDYLIFRSVIPVQKTNFEDTVNKQNSKPVKAKLFHYKDDTREYFDNVIHESGNEYPFTMKIQNLKFLKFEYQIDNQIKEKYIIIHNNQNFKRLDDNFFTFNAEDDMVQGLEFATTDAKDEMVRVLELLFENKRIQKLMTEKIQKDTSEKFFLAGYFQCLVNNRKDASIERGSLYRSLSLFSSNLNILGPFLGVQKKYMKVYIEYSGSQSEAGNIDKKLDELLQDCYQSIKMFTVNPQVNLKINLNLLFIEEAASYAKDVEFNLIECSLLSLVKIVGPTIMIVYRAILREDNVVVLGQKMKCMNLITFCCAFQSLVRPINVIHKIYPFEHIQSLGLFNNIKGYILGITNPIVCNEKIVPWNLLVDLNKGEVYGKGMALKEKTDVLSQDWFFISEILEKIKTNKINEQQIRKYFYQYTKNNLDISIGRSNIIDLRKETNNNLNEMYEMRKTFMETSFFASYDLYFKNIRESFKEIFGAETYLGVYQAYKYLTDQNIYQELELLISFSNLNKFIDTNEKADFFVKKQITALGDIECLTVGILSSNEELRKENFKQIKVLEQSDFTRKALGTLSLQKLLLIQEEIMNE